MALPNKDTKLTVLYVEDEAIISIAITECLQEAGYDVESLVTCDEASVYLKKNSVDLLITDISTPGQMDGWDLAIEARKIDPEIPVLYVTAYGKKNEKRVSNSSYVSKPFTNKDLMKEVKKLMV